MLSIIRFLFRVIGSAFDERKFLRELAGVLTQEMRQSAAVNSAVAEINRLVDRVDGVVNDDSPKIYFARHLVMAQVKDLAGEYPAVAKAMAVGEEYLSLVLDGLTVEELLTAPTPLKTLVADKAVAIANDLVS